ncbi:uncharacterized protein LOC116340980 isoform X2 [Contarinia nasturtii]|uniref:uncharacterized protein LOC116340980 isoform X2 n=1 Tax=Contarinia nasturtii TaxID=265458 RepID=UPI0012D41B9A|nr:uncharacterized protein LOC116340980 isoform X2 [Contarinia nasturtii]
MPKLEKFHKIYNLSSLFDTYTCDLCGNHFPALNDCQEHMKMCQNDDSSITYDDDIIFCDNPIPEQSPAQSDFLESFGLTQSGMNKAKNSEQAISSDNHSSTNLLKKNKRSGRSLGISALLRSQIPITSPGGQRLIAPTKALVNDEYTRERIERYERYCIAPPLSHYRPTFLDKNAVTFDNCSFRNNNSTNNFHWYKFPRRQFSTKTYDEAFAQYKRIQKFVNYPTRQYEVHRNRLKIRYTPEAYIDLCSDDEETKTKDSAKISHEPLDTDDSSNNTDATSTPSICRKFEDTKSTSKVNLFELEHCSISNDDSVESAVDLLLTQRPQITITRIKCDPSTNLLNEQPKRYSKLYKDALEIVNLQCRQQNKENHLYANIDEESNDSDVIIANDSNQGSSLTSVTSNSLNTIDLTFF